MNENHIRFHYKYNDCDGSFIHTLTHYHLPTHTYTTRTDTVTWLDLSFVVFIFSGEVNNFQNGQKGKCRRFWMAYGVE